MPGQLYPVIGVRCCLCCQTVSVLLFSPLTLRAHCFGGNRLTKCVFKYPSFFLEKCCIPGIRMGVLHLRIFFQVHYICKTWSSLYRTRFWPFLTTLGPPPPILYAGSRTPCSFCPVCPRSSPRLVEKETLGLRVSLRALLAETAQLCCRCGIEIWSV